MCKAFVKNSLPWVSEGLEGGSSGRDSQLVSRPVPPRERSQLAASWAAHPGAVGQPTPVLGSPRRARGGGGRVVCALQGTVTLLSRSQPLGTGPVLASPRGTLQNWRRAVVPAESRAEGAKRSLRTGNQCCTGADWCLPLCSHGAVLIPQPRAPRGGRSSPKGWGSPGGVPAGHGADPGPLPLQVILSESSPAGEVPFFETWMLTCMPEEGKILNPDHPCFCPDSTKVESLVALLNNSSEMKLV